MPYIRNWSHEGDALVPGLEPELADGVRGTAFDTDRGVYIPLIAAEHPGTGAVGAFLDALPKDRRVVFPAVLNSHLHAMLIRRGFVDIDEDGSAVMERKPLEGAD